MRVRIPPLRIRSGGMILHEAAEFDELWPGARFLRSADGFRPGTDSVLLAVFAGIQGVRRFADLGCGAGVLTVLLLQRAAGARAVGLELQPEAATLCRENLAANGLAGRAEIHTADLRAHRALLEAGAFDLTVANPPYFSTGSGFPSPDAQRAHARDERSCTLQDVCAAAGYLTRWGGRFALVHRPERLSELFCAMTAAGIEPKRLRMVCASAARAPSLVLAEGRRGGKPGLVIEPPLVLTGPDGGESPEVREIYHRR